ncbi:MAG TPA: nuclear transport factor 2 family protein [Pyrinomonadaceae bacterium]|nr:nuclear transport factor 2 family protein [Pyrinomonadaceae bacterium]
MKEQENVQTVREVYAAFQQGDIQGVLDRLTDDVRWWVNGSADSVPFAGERTGRDEVAEFFNVLDGAFEFETFEPQEYIAQGERVVALGRDRRRAKSNNRVIENQWAMVFTVRAGKVADFRAYDDTEAESSAMRAVAQHTALSV